MSADLVIKKILSRGLERSSQYVFGLAVVYSQQLSKKVTPASIAS